MWKSQIGVGGQHQANADDDWDTDPDYVVGVTLEFLELERRRVNGDGACIAE